MKISNLVGVLNVQRCKCIIFFGKKDVIADLALTYIENIFNVIKVVYGDDKLTEVLLTELTNTEFTYIFSFMNPKLIKNEYLLTKKCINFHPSLPKYRGVCCASVALFNNDKTYGATAHIINDKIDSGGILKVKTIPIFENEDCFSLSFRAKLASLDLLYELCDYINQYKTFPPIDLTYCWGTTLMTYKKFKKWITVKQEDIDSNKIDIQQLNKAIKNKHYSGPFIT